MGFGPNVSGLASGVERSSMDLELTGKRALVTGGSRGIGKAIASQLALEGADVAIAARDRARIDATVAEIAAASGRRIFGTSSTPRWPVRHGDGEGRRRGARRDRHPRQRRRPPGRPAASAPVGTP